MYQVVTVLDGKEYTLLDLRLEKYKLINPVLTLGLNRTGSLSFSVPYSHPNLSKIDAMRSVIKVYWIKKNKSTKKWSSKWIYSGRPVTSEEDFYRTGKIECEGILAYLIDSRVRPYSFSGAPADYLDQLRLQHNSQVGAGKQFLKGNVDVADVDNNNYITRSFKGSEEYPNTLDEVSEKLVESLGVYLSARETNGSLYLDCISSLPHNTQKICFGKNLLDLVRKKDATTIYTAIIPLGAEEETEEEGESSGKRLTIQYYCPSERPEDWAESFKDYCTRTGSEEEGYQYTFLTGSSAPQWVADTYFYGLDFIYDRSLRAKYDTVTTVHVWDDVTLQSNLFRKGKQYLKTCLLTDSLTVSAADLSLTAEDVEAFYLGWVTLISKPHGLNEEMLLSEMQIPLLDPLNATFTIGSTIETLTEKTNRSEKEFNNQIQEVKSTAQKIKANTKKQIDEAVDTATNLITGAVGGYVTIERDENGYPWRILVMDAPSTSAAKNIIQINKNGIGFSTNGINGPYKNAWTIDGHLVADFITAGNLIAGTVGGWTIMEHLIQDEIQIDGYTYQIAMQTPDGSNTTNCYYVRRKPTSETADIWEYVFRIRYDGTITVTRGTIGGWTVTDTTISQKETLTVDATDYVYHICLQSVSDEKETANYIYVRRYPASQSTPADASGWEYLAKLDKYGNFKCQQLRARKSLQCGQVSITPSAADTPTSVAVKFDEPMWKKPVVIVSAHTAYPGTVVSGVSTLNESTEGFTLYLTRKNTTETTIGWVAMAD